MPNGREAPPVRVVTPTYFPGVSSPDDAKPLRLDIGREVRVDFRLSRRVSLWKVRGQTMNGATGRSVAARITLTPPAQDPSFTRYRAQSSVGGPDPGEFTIVNVAPGSYILMIKSGSGNQEITSVRRIVLRPVRYALTRPPEDAASFTLIPPLSITGRLSVESGEAADFGATIVALL